MADALADETARQRIDDHIRGCEEQGRQMNARLTSIDAKLDQNASASRAATGRVHERIDRMLWAVIVAAGGALSTLVIIVLTLAGVLK